MSLFISILYVGPILEGSTTLQRLRALRDLGHHVTEVTTRHPEQRAGKTHSLYSRIQNRIFGPQDTTDANNTILRHLTAGSFDLVWIDKGRTIKPETLVRARELHPDLKLVGFSPDDQMNPGNQSSQWLESLPMLDAFITTKSYNLHELKSRGCSRVLLMANGFDPHTHRPGAITKRPMINVSFIGQWEAPRAESLRYLAEEDIQIDVWGYTWERMKDPPQSLILHNEPLWDTAYAQTINDSKINLCFLRKANRDLQTTRSIEIPACRGFMLAERTDEHLSLFEEDREAVYFSSNEELCDKVNYYLKHESERAAIAMAGYNRCIEGGYDYASRLRTVLDELYD